MLNFDVYPYYDDTSASGGAIENNYMRILFRPGYAVQARELTALQSILQNQISQLGEFVFQNGSPVHGGHISLDPTVQAIQLQSQYANVDISLADFLVDGNATLVINGAGNVKAFVIATDSTQTNPVIIVKYLTSDQFSNTDTVQVASGLQTQAYVYNSNTFSSPASTASINQGVFYSGGFFVDVSPQTIVLDSTTNAPTYRVGLEISEAIIDEVSDTNLLDPAQGSFNYQAPGATRYQYNLTLAKRSLSSIDDSSFYELLRVENGLITKQIDYPIFADLDKALAQRTYDTAGDFTVTPFVISTQDNPSNTAQYYIVVEPGKAYVKGFEFHTIGTQKLASDKARTTNTVTDYGMSLNYGNFLIATNLYGGNTGGINDVTQYQSIDLHVANSAFINTATVGNYTSTLMGTARVRNIEFAGLNTYYVYVTEVNITSNNFTAAAGNLNSITLPSTYSNLANVYANVIVTVNTGGIIDTRTITSYNSSRVAILNRNLSLNATSSSNVTLTYAIKDIAAGVITPNTFSGNVYYNQNTTSAIYPCFDISPGGKTATGNTYLNDTQFNKLIFPLGQIFVAQNTVANASFQTRKNLWSQTFTSGNLTISGGSGLGTGESFPYGYTNSYLPDITANNNFIVVVRNALSSNLANGQLLNFNRGTVTGGNGIYQTDSTHVTVVSSANNTFIGDIIFTAQDTNAAVASVARRTKTLVGNSSNTLLLTTDKYTNASQVIGSSPANTVYIDTSNGYVWFLSNAAMAMTPGASQSLYIPDVFNVIKVYDSGNTSYAPNVSNTLIDITSNYYLNSGQKDNYYDHSALILKPGANPPAGQTVVLCQYYQHDTIGSPVQGFFDCDSYSANVYASGLIPYYSSQNFGTLCLRDSIDFRPSRTIGMSANVNLFNLNGLKIPEPSAAMTLSYQFYLPRIDKLMLSKDKTFRISQGVPAQNPVAPSDSDDAMTLYIITLPAYTGNVFQIQAQYIEHKRYTMQDVGVLDKRIQALELQSTLNALEQQAIQEKILYQDGITPKGQYGIVADDFGSYTVCDNQNVDLRCHMAGGSLTPYKNQSVFEMDFQSATGSYNQSGKCYTLPFTETAAVIQNTATTYVSVQPFLFAQFKGHTTLTPETTTSYSTQLPPVIVAPPTSTAPDQPPVPAKTPAPTLITSNTTTQTVTTFVNSRIDFGTYGDWWDYYDYRAGNRFYTRVPRRYYGYGAIHPFYNWYGVAKEVTTTATTTTTTVPNSGSSIQLANRSAANVAVTATVTKGAIPLFGRAFGGGK